MSGYPLRQIYFYLTAGCNLACRHCWLAPKRDADGTRYPVLAPPAFEEILRQAKPLGLQSVKLTGGEPLLHPDISTLLAAVRREGLRLAVETNGVLCTPELAIEIASAGEPFVSVSLDGADAAAHDWVRGVPGSFEQALEGIRHLAAAGIRPQVVFSILRHNAGQIEAVVRLAESLGAGSVKFNVVQPIERGAALHGGEQNLAVSELIEIGRRVEGELARSTRLRLFFHYPPAFRSLRTLSAGDGCSVCGIKEILGVLPDGEYALCGIGVHEPELVFGRVGVVPLAEVWRDHPVLNTVRDGLPGRLEGVCGRCLMNSRCLGGCLALNFYRSRNLFAAHWFCEAAESQGLFPTSRLMPE
ncbi:MAG: SynChlorMet cassette radical SAM/SPASM protein ScmF [Anaerolineales bacterium]|nr:SynChlorMet cassette radical SAM/SPASM protein ScmF [Anaerolineales bacterium]